MTSKWVVRVWESDHRCWTKNEEVNSKGIQVGDRMGIDWFLNANRETDTYAFKSLPVIVYTCKFIIVIINIILQTINDEEELEEDQVEGTMGYLQTPFYFHQPTRLFKDNFNLENSNNNHLIKYVSSFK